MRKIQALTGWRSVLQGRRPFLSIEVTRQCPLRCPGCYAYWPDHPGPSGPDYTGGRLVEGILAAVRKYRPLHLSLIGGEPLVRHRELDALLPRLAPLEVQLVTSAVRPIPRAWAAYPHLHLAVSVDGLPREHDRRRTPATYERILANIAGHRVIVHCTITRQLLQRPGYLRDFAAFWSARHEARKIWFSLFTPQNGRPSEERLTAGDRQFAIAELAALHPLFPKVELHRLVLDGFARPPASPAECLFAQLTTCIAADLETAIRPCQLGGAPECRECGCLAAAALSALGRYRLAGVLPVERLIHLSKRAGQLRRPQDAAGPPLP